MAEAQFSVKLHSNRINCNRFQFRLTLAWAYTVHKVQDLTLGKGGVCLQFYNQNTSNAAQGYVGLFSIICAIHSDYIKTNPSAVAEYDRLRKESTIFKDNSEST